MYIAVLQGDIGRANWVAVLKDDDLNVLKAKTTYNSAVNDIFAKSAGDQDLHLQIQITDTSAAAGSPPSTADLYQI